MNGSVKEPVRIKRVSFYIPESLPPSVAAYTAPVNQLEEPAGQVRFQGSIDSNEDTKEDDCLRSIYNLIFLQDDTPFSPACRLIGSIIAVCTTLIVIIGLVFGKCEPKQGYDADIAPLTTTTTGDIKGKIVKIGNHEVLAFLGIPYAKPPVDQYRFKKPIAIKHWQGIFDASTKPTPCMQTKSKDFPWVAKQEPSEDCLYLNIWVPKKFCSLISSNCTTADLPIMIWIHGGGFWSGSSALDMYDGAAMAAYGNVIVASMNYRVGAFGFLYSGTPDAPGNMGLLDQKLAIEWIKDNARAFCGDASSITLFGQSAGSISVGLHLISPMSRNLFKRAIMQSGSPYHPLTTLDLNMVKLKDSGFATALGCANETVNLVTNPERVIECMRNLDANHIVGAEAVVLERAPVSFFPIHGDDFMPETPPRALKSGDFKHAELLIGNNEDEGSIFLTYSVPELFTSESAPDLPLLQARMVIESLFKDNPIPTGKEVADFYLKDLTDEEPKIILKAMHDSFGDFLFVCPSVLFAEKVAEENDVYYYSFTHRSSQSKWGDWIGVAHMDEMPFVFGESLKPKSPYTDEECRFSHSMVQKWTSFARNGKPESSYDTVWPTYSASENQYSELNTKGHKIGRGPHVKGCNYWRNYFSQL